MKYAVFACALNGLLFGAIKLFYELIGGMFSTLLYCAFLGITVTLSVGAGRKEALSYLGNLGIGLFWVWLYVEVETIFLIILSNEWIGKAVAFALVSFVIEVANSFLLRKSKWNYPTHQFAVIIGCFSQKCQHVPLVMAGLVLGVVAAIISKAIYARYFKLAK